MNATTSTVTATVYSPTAGIVWKGETIEAAKAFARGQNAACAAQGGRGDRSAYVVDADGWLRDDLGRHVWPAHGRSAGALRV